MRLNSSIDSGLYLFDQVPRVSKGTIANDLLDLSGNLVSKPIRKHSIGSSQPTTLEEALEALAGLGYSAKIRRLRSHCKKQAEFHSGNAECGLRVIKKVEYMSHDERMLWVAGGGRRKAIYSVCSRRLSEYIGQSKLKDEITIYIQAINKGKALGACLTPGYGLG